MTWLMSSSTSLRKIHSASNYPTSIFLLKKLSVEGNLLIINLHKKQFSLRILRKQQSKLMTYIFYHPVKIQKLANHIYGCEIKMGNTVSCLRFGSLIYFIFWCDLIVHSIGDIRFTYKNVVESKYGRKINRTLNS